MTEGTVRHHCQRAHQQASDGRQKPSLIQEQ